MAVEAESWKSCIARFLIPIDIVHRGEAVYDNKRSTISSINNITQLRICCDRLRSKSSMKVC